eukprot:UN27798
MGMRRDELRPCGQREPKLGYEVWGDNQEDDAILCTPSVSPFDFIASREFLTVLLQTNNSEVFVNKHVIDALNVLWGFTRWKFYQDFRNYIIFWLLYALFVHTIIQNRI